MKIPVIQVLVCEYFNCEQLKGGTVPEAVLGYGYWLV